MATGSKLNYAYWEADADGLGCLDCTLPDGACYSSPECPHSATSVEDRERREAKESAVLSKIQAELTRLNGVPLGLAAAARVAGVSRTKVKRLARDGRLQLSQARKGFSFSVDKVN